MRSGAEDYALVHLKAKTRQVCGAGHRHVDSSSQPPGKSILEQRIEHIHIGDTSDILQPRFLLVGVDKLAGSRVVDARLVIDAHGSSRIAHARHHDFNDAQAVSGIGIGICPVRRRNASVGQRDALGGEIPFGVCQDSIAARFEMEVAHVSLFALFIEAVDAAAAADIAQRQIADFDHRSHYSPPP